MSAKSERQSLQSKLTKSTINLLQKCPSEMKSIVDQKQLSQHLSLKTIE